MRTTLNLWISDHITNLCLVNYLETKDERWWTLHKIRVDEIIDGRSIVETNNKDDVNTELDRLFINYENRI